MKPKTDEEYVYVGCFWTRIADWDEDGFYELHNDTVPNTVDQYRHFKTIENAKLYFYSSIEKSCKDALKELKKIRLEDKKV
jgi:hypothetical protein